MEQLSEDLMIDDVTVIRADRDVHELEQLLLREQIHGVPVVDAEGKLVGVASQTDLLAWHFMTGVDGATFYDGPEASPLPGEARNMTRVTDIRTARVDELMSPVIHCICADQSLALAAARMLTRRVHRLVVVDKQGCVLGVISALDMLHVVPGVEDAMQSASDEYRMARKLASRGHVRPPRDAEESDSGDPGE
jgi:CBS-domain-containing membrane protein